VDVAVARDRLEGMLADLERSRATLAAENPEDEAKGRESRSADPGAALAYADREEAVVAAMERQRTQVTAALGRIDAGTYGRCIDCGAALPDERLDARPEAARCVKDQARAENGR
jgi:RNA polymerase-binding transcription factor DksA